MTTLIASKQNINTFFDHYAKALENYDSKSMAYMYSFPCTMLSDEATTVFNDAGKLEGFFNQGITFYKQFGIAKVRPELWSRRDWSEKTTNVKVTWQYFDALDQPIYSCDYFYVLKVDKNNNWRIVLSVSVNEKERMQQWQASARS
jgi:hypothetical protein